MSAPNPSSPIILRYYQQDAVQSFTDYILKYPTGNPLIVLPTATGKSYVLAEMVRSYVKLWDARIVVVTHDKKLVRQDHDKTEALWPEGSHLFGVNSEGLGKRDTNSQVLFCGIQSVYTSAEAIGKVNLLIIDEAHRADVLKSKQYKRFIEDLTTINPKMRVGGLTATPFRMSTGLIYGNEPHHLFTDVVYDGNLKEFIAKKFVATPISVPPGDLRIDMTGVRIQGDDYHEQDIDQRFNVPEIIKGQIGEALKKCAGRKSIAVFAINIDHAENIKKALVAKGQTVAVIHSKIEEDDDKLLKAFVNGEYRFLISVNMFVEGFDCPQIDALIDLKPTASLGRFVQMVGRGFRICEITGKYDFLYLDFSGNIGSHGPIDQANPEPTIRKKQSKGAPKKQCEECGEMVHARFKYCPYCDWKFPFAEAEDNTLSTAGTDSLVSDPKWFDVRKVHCSEKKGNILAHYYCPGRKFKKVVDFSAKDGQEWLKDHLGDDIPFDARNFMNGGYRTKMNKPLKIFVDDCGSASTISRYEFAN